VATLNRCVPVIFNRQALENDGEHGREHPGAHEHGHSYKYPMEPPLRKNSSVEGENAPFDGDDDDGIYDFGGDEVLAQGISLRTRITQLGIRTICSSRGSVTNMTCFPKPLSVHNPSATQNGI